PIQNACAVEIAIAPSVQDMADVEPAGPAGEGCRAGNIDGAAVTEEVVKLGVIRKLIVPGQVEQGKPARESRGCSDVIKKDVFLSVIGANLHQIRLIANHVNQLKLLEE